MADGFWNRQPPLQSMAMPKRPRSDLDIQAGLSGYDMVNYYPREDLMFKDTTSVGASYDRYLQSTQGSSFGPGEASSYVGAGLGRDYGGVGLGREGLSGLPLGEPVIGGPGYMGPDMAPNGRTMVPGIPLASDPGARQNCEMHLPPDASATLFVEGLPPDSTKREVAHIFRPFLGYKEVRLVTKESRQHEKPLILCFVDFTNAACASTALNALQGYKMDEHDLDSPYLRLQFARFPGPRSGSRGRR